MSGDLDKVRLARALPEHFQPILDISHGIYNGLDYFASVYHAWLDEEERDPAARRSVVLLDQDNKVAGYQSFLFMDSGRRVLAQALRIDPRLKGRGVGKRFMELCRHFLVDINPEVIDC